MKLKGKVVWITGSSRRMGRAMALGCAREGANVVVHCRTSVDAGKSVVGELEKLGTQALLVVGDTGSPVEVSRMVSEIEERFERLDALVNSAAIFPREKVLEITEKDFFNVLRSNLYGPFLCTQFAEPMLRRAAPGHVVNITDWAVERPYRFHAHYMAAKGGLHTMTRALARELAPEILVNEIAPGPMLEPDNMDPGVRDSIIEKMPIGRWGTPAAVVKSLIFVLESEELCGTTLVVDGGRSLR